MGSFLVVGRDRSTEAIQVDHLVRVVELEDAAYTLNCLQVLVAVRVEVVEGAGLIRYSVR